jgi:hypothetical protein
VRFGRVEGVVVPEEGAEGVQLRLTVYLESGAELRVVRDEVMRPLRPVQSVDDLVWHADQWTQETIGVDLAAEGWEAIGAGDLPTPEDGELARSAAYAVRRLS